MRKKLFFPIILGIFVLALGIALGIYISLKLKKGTSETESLEIPKISIEELKQKMDKGENFVLIDSRSSVEYEEEHIKGAISIPYQQREELASNLDKNKEIIIYCRGEKCGTSEVSGKKLIALGFKNVKELKGGVKEWKEAGGKTEKGPDVTTKPQQNTFSFLQQVFAKSGFGNWVLGFGFWVLFILGLILFFIWFWKLENRLFLRKQPISLISILLIILAAGLIATANFYQKSEPIVILPPQDMSPFPGFVISASQNTKEAYMFATEKPETLDQIPCWCEDCNKDIKTVKDCFITRVNPEGIDYTIQALYCKKCVNIALEVKKLLNEGKSLQEIQSYIENKYGK
jgi:rhodanese-related sulfurtransferase